MTQQRYDSHNVYCKAYEKAQHARDDGKVYIAVQHARDGSFRLIQTNKPNRAEYCFQQPRIITWAENLTYRLAELGYVEGGKDAVDRYFDRVRHTGHGVKNTCCPNCGSGNTSRVEFGWWRCARCCHGFEHWNSSDKTQREIELAPLAAHRGRTE